MFNPLFEFIREHYQTQNFIPLHAPVFAGHEREYLLDAIDSTFVSSVGAYVDRFEREVASYTGSPGAVVTVNGTSALHMALILAGVRDGDYVITQALTLGIGVLKALFPNFRKYCDQKIAKKSLNQPRLPAFYRHPTHVCEKSTRSTG